MATLTETITNLRDALDQGGTSFHTDAELTVWINEACRDIARRTETLQTTDDISITAGVQQYALPTDIVRIYRMEFQATGDDRVYPLEYRDYNAMDEVWWASQRSASAAYPSAFTMWGFPPTLNVVLYPTPSAAGTLRVYYYQYPAALTTAAPNTTVPVPMGWEDLVIDYAEYRALRKARDPRWQEAKALYEEKLTAMFDISRRWTDQPGTFVSGRGSLGPLPGWLVEG